MYKKLQRQYSKYPVTPMLTPYITMVHTRMSKLIREHWYMSITQATNFTIAIQICSRINSGHQFRTPHRIQSSRFLWPESVSQSFRIVHDLNSCEEDWSGILQNVLNLGLSNVWLPISLGFWILGRNTTEVKCSAHHIISGNITSTHFSLVTVNLISWFRQCWPGFTTNRYFSFCISCSLEVSHQVQPILKCQGIATCIIWNSFVRKIFSSLPLSPLFI